jgi:hypothetical protein
MNYAHKVGLTLLVALGVSNAAFAYKFRFANHTAEEVQIRLNLAGDGKDWTFTLAPRGQANQEHDEWFPWIHEKITDWELNRRAGFCWSAISMKRKILDNTGNMVWGPWKQVNIQYIESNQYTAMTDASDKAASAIANVGLAAGGKESAGEGSQGIAKGIGSLVAYGQCKNRDFDVVYADKKGKELAIVSLAQ